MAARPAITYTNHDSKGNPGRWSQQSGGKWVFTAQGGPQIAGAWQGIANVVPTTAAGYSPPATAGTSAGGTSYTPPPVDPVYDQQVGGLTRRRDDSYADIKGRQDRTLIDYGYNATFDANGVLTGLTVDPSNPFSRAALLQKSYQQNKAGNVNSYAAKGMYRSGALQNAQNQAEFNYQQGSDALQKQLTSSLAGYQSERANAGTDYEIGVGQAKGDSIGRAQNSPLYTPTTAAAAAPKGYQEVAGTSKAGVKGVWHIYPDGRKVFVRK